MGYPQFLSFIDKAAHVEPGFMYKDKDRRRYQKLVTNVIFANQLVAGGIFDDTNDRFECKNGKFIVMFVISVCLIFILLVIIYSLRRTCHKLEDRLRPCLLYTSDAADE